MMARPFGTPQSPETREKIRIARLGNSTITLEGREKLSAFQKSFTGRYKAFGSHNISPEGREKMRLNGSRIGEFAPHWQGGVGSENRRLRNRLIYTEWRLEVLNRDQYTCQQCQRTEGKLTVHHIKPFRSYVELRYNIDNGITLCPRCHAEVDSYFANFQSEIQGEE